MRIFHFETTIYSILEGYHLFNAHLDRQCGICLFAALNVGSNIATDPLGIFCFNSVLRVSLCFHLKKMESLMLSFLYPLTQSLLPYY